ncbi:MAG: glycosyltransferase [Promethearchaeota archaeon]|nr:MAG: glycosyltransferase [Candidatus Lokiarchaeota archaeon]
MDYFTFHVLALLIFDLIILLISLINLFTLKRINNFPEIKEYPKVSILVPARNEEDSIEKCIISLLNQNYPSFEVIVLNDNSADRTGMILESIKKKYENLIIINGNEKPKEWIGKNWACHQLSQKAEGELYLFTDADTYHKENSLVNAVNCFMYKKLDLLTVIPKQIVKSWSEQFIIPIMHWSILSFLPIKLAEKVKSPKLQITIGQYMLFRGSKYQKMGGHETIKTEIIDDMPLGRLTKSLGYKWGIADGSDNIECRMYKNFKEVYNGFTRTLFCVFNYNIPIFLWVWFFLALVAIQPIVIIFLFLLNIEIPRLILIFSILTLFLSFLLWAISIIRFKYPKYLILIYPITMLMILIIAIRSMYQTLTGKIKWKGRSIEK